MPYTNTQHLTARQTMSEDLCGIALAAGAGTRLQPLTRLRPKPLCPVDNVALLDHTRLRLASVTDAVAVNTHHNSAQIAAHLEGPGTVADTPLAPVHLSVEQPEALGTAGAVGQLRDWVDGRAIVVLNSDTWCPGSLVDAVASWDRTRVRVLVVGDDQLRPAGAIAGIFLPWAEAARLRPEPSGLYEMVLRGHNAAGQLDVLRWDGPCIDCGTPRRYLAANLAASGGISVVGAGARVEGSVERTVVWPDAEVAPGEHLVDAVRTDGGVTVLVR